MRSIALSIRPPTPDIQTDTTDGTPVKFSDRTGGRGGDSDRACVLVKQ